MRGLIFCLYSTSTKILAKAVYFFSTDWLRQKEDKTSFTWTSFNTDEFSAILAETGFTPHASAVSQAVQKRPDARPPKS